jgi:hypothetical protein
MLVYILLGFHTFVSGPLALISDITICCLACSSHMAAGRSSLSAVVNYHVGSTTVQLSHLWPHV